MVTDYEAAWHELAAFVAGKTQHGREGLLTRMAELTDAHRVPAGELSRLLRLYGIEVERARSMSIEPEDVAGGFVGGLVSPADAGNPRHHDGDHDGNGREHRSRSASAVG